MIYGYNGSKETYCLCDCDCGNTNIIKLLQSIKRGFTTCGHCIEFNLEHNFFESINTEEKAYILGFLYTDGWTNGRDIIELTLQKRDMEILQEIANKLNFIGNITESIKQNRYETCRLCIHSKKMTSDIVNKGCLPNKTYQIKFPSFDIIPQKHMKHFIRGCLDGDGSICFSKKQCHVSFVGNENMVIGMEHYLHTYENFKTRHVNLYKNDNINFCRMNIAGNRNCKLFLDWLYHDSTIYLKRKFLKYMQLVDEVYRVDSIKPQDRKGLIRPPVKLYDRFLKITYNSMNECSKATGITYGVLKRMCENNDDRICYVENRDNINVSKQRKGRGVIQRDIDHKILNKYISMAEAQRSTGISNKYIWKVCNGLEKTAGGYIWEYAS